MVSKVAVIALVVIVAAPILLGYGMNFQSVTETRYIEDSQQTNVTDLLQNSTAYSYSAANVYSLNTNNFAVSLNGTDWVTNGLMLPMYESIMSGTKSALPLMTGELISGSSWTLSDWTYIVILNPGAYSSQLDASVTGASIYTNHTNAIFWDGPNGTIYVSEVISNGTVLTYKSTTGNVLSISGTVSNDAVYYYSYSNPALNTGFADVIGGFRFPGNIGDFGTTSRPFYTYWRSPANADSILMTIDLNTIPSGEYNSIFNIRAADGVDRYINFHRTQSGGNVNFDVYSTYTVTGTPVFSNIIYDNSNPSNNVYQIRMDLNGYELRYIGSWPNTIGAANVYRTYAADWTSPIGDGDHILGFQYTVPGVTVPGSAVLRIDEAALVASTYSVISGTTYDPAKITGYTNMKTTIDVITPGSSLSFGGNTYVIDRSGNITMGTHQIGVNKIRLSSVYDSGTGQYINTINGTQISTTATPSTIGFGGVWAGANVITKNIVPETYNVDKWIPGEFAWDGIDDNFLMVGLLTSLGVFIALGVYSRRSKGNMIPLMLVAGGAAFVFLLMM